MDRSEWKLIYRDIGNFFFRFLNPSEMKKVESRESPVKFHGTPVKFFFAGASRSFFMISTLLPISFMGFLYIVYDVINNKPADRSDLVRRLQKDANEVSFSFRGLLWNYANCFS